MDAHENPAGEVQEPVTRKKKKEKMYFNVDNFVSFCPAIKQGQKSTANNEIFPTVGRNTGENNFYYNIALFCC